MAHQKAEWAHNTIEQPSPFRQREGSKVVLSRSSGGTCQLAQARCHSFMGLHAEPQTSREAPGSGISPEERRLYLSVQCRYSTVAIDFLAYFCRERRIENVCCER